MATSYEEMKKNLLNKYGNRSSGSGTYVPDERTDEEKKTASENYQKKNKGKS